MSQLIFTLLETARFIGNCSVSLGRKRLARALSYEPDFILADEPTGNLDGETQEEIMKILRELADNGKCVIVVTHSPTVAKMADEVYSLSELKG